MRIRLPINVPDMSVKLIVVDASPISPERFLIRTAGRSLPRLYVAQADSNL